MPGVYVHIPFCLKKCAYCDFYSIPRESGAVELFLSALEGELSLMTDLPEGRLLSESKTLYLGGGTPTCLSENHLEALFEILLKRVDIGSKEEVTVEANPSTITPGKASLLKDFGVTRVSLGAQSFHDEILSFLGRIHGEDETRDSFETLTRSGFENINLDLIFGIPGQTDEMLLKDLSTAVSLSPTHLSLYALSVEEGTPLMREVLAGLDMPEEDEVARQYELARENAKNSGFSQYEVSNFSLPGFECRHNLGYWLCEEYLGLGPSASGFVMAEKGSTGLRWTNVRNLEAYAESVRNGDLPREETTRLDREELWRERLMMGLRLTAGVDLGDAETILGPIPKSLEENLKALLGRGLIGKEGARIFIPEERTFTMNSVLSMLI